MLWHATVGGAGFSIIRAYDVAPTATARRKVGDAERRHERLGAPFLPLRQEGPQATVALAIVDALGRCPVRRDLGAR